MFKRSLNKGRHRAHNTSHARGTYSRTGQQCTRANEITTNDSWGNTTRNRPGTGNLARTERTVISRTNMTRGSSRLRTLRRHHNSNVNRTRNQGVAGLIRRRAGNNGRRRLLTVNKYNPRLGRTLTITHGGRNRGR